MSSIFEDGYLKPEFINANYRGLVGWDCRIRIGMCHHHSNDKVVALTDSKAITALDDVYDKDTLMISQFTPADIPVGELCWFWKNHCNKVLEVFDGVRICRDNVINTSKSSEWYCVPYLIAETEEEAERLKNWSENE